MRTCRFYTLSLALAIASFSSARAADQEISNNTLADDQAILQSAGNAMVFQLVFSDMALALTEDPAITKLASHIHELSDRGLRHIEAMAAECGVPIEAHLDATAWRRIGALREITTAVLRDQVYLDAQLMRLVEARAQNEAAGNVAKHDTVKRFTERSEPEIEALISRISAVVQAWPTSEHR